MQWFRKFCLLLACGAALDAAAQNQPVDKTATNGLPPVRKTRVISLAECIQLALQNNLDIQIQLYNPRIGEFTLRSDYGAYDPTASFSANKQYNDLPGGFDPQSGLVFPNSVTEANNYTPTIQGTLPTGLSYEFTGTVSRESERSTTTPPYWLPPNWVSDGPGAGIILSQPLLKNLWIDKSRLQIRLDKATLKISEYALRLQVMTTVTSVKSAYYTLLYNRGNVEANATALQLAQQLVAENLKRVQVGSLARLDEKQLS